MKLFQNLFKAKWQHKDPETRKHALLTLDPASNQDIFLRVAESDDVPEIRILAVKRITGLNQLKTIALDNDDLKTRELAHKMLCQMYAGEIDSEFAIEQHPEQISQLDDQRIIEYVCKNGINSTIRRNAIEHLKRDSLLGNLAINDLDPSLRILAAKKITQQSTLERVYKNTKTRDKTVSNIVKIKLDELIKAQQEPIKRIEQQKQLCLQLESLGSKGLWERDKIQFDHIEQQWNALESHAEEFVSRFAKAKQKFLEAYEAYLKRHEERLKQEQALLPIKNKKQDIISRLNSLWSELQSVAESDNISTLRTEFENTVKTWREIDKLPKEIEEEIEAQYKDIHSLLENGFKQHIQNNELIKTYRSLQAELNKILEKPRLLSEKTLNNIESRYKQAQNLPGGALTNQLKLDIKNLIQKAKEKIQNKQQEIEKKLKLLESQLPIMEKKLEAGVLKEAITARKIVQDAINALEDLGYRKLDSFKKRAAAATSQINELANWRSWANTPQKEELCQKVEALIGSDEHPKDIAFIISQARKDWKKLGPSERDSSQQLWERFQAACNTAYEPCKKYYAEESKHKQENYQKRLGFVEDLEKFIEAADWSTIDWKKVESLFRHSRTEWKEIGHTEADQRKELNKRFYAAYEEIKTHLNKEWEHNKERKQQIINDAKALENEENLNTAISKAKDLQSQWKEAGRIPQTQERAMWAEFRKSCDAVFNRRDQIKEQEKEALQDLSNKKAELCTQLEAITQLPISEMMQQQASFEKIRRELKNIGPTIKSVDAKLESRLSEILHIHERKMESANRLDVIDKLNALQTAAKELEKIEQAIESNLSPLQINEHIEATQQIIDDSKDEIGHQWLQQLEERLDKVIKIASTQNFAETLKSSMAQVAEEKRFATIQLEILANVDTPAEFANDRLTVQTQRLNDKLKNHEEEDHWQAFIDAESKWWLLGPTISDDLIAMKERRITALKRLTEEYPDELKSYQ